MLFLIRGYGGQQLDKVTCEELLGRIKESRKIIIIITLLVKGKTDGLVMF